MASNREDWSSVLTEHPIFSLPDGFNSLAAYNSERSLELSTNTLAKFTQLDPTEDGPTPSGRRQVMVLKDADLILAAGREVRITSLGDSRLNRADKKLYKVLHTPNIQFEIHQLSLNPSGKLLAVAGAFQVGVIVMPRPGFTRLVPTAVDCKSIQVGQFHHATNSSAAIAKIEWHPWGEAGSTLMVMTTDGKLREYDISQDTEEPQQVLSFVPERKSKSYIAEDVSEREVSSFTLGTGKGDWGPLTIYAVTKSGDIYSICPYMPQNASIPSSYVHALECFIAAKQEYLSQYSTTTTKSLTTMYDYQRKFINALIKQLPPGTLYPAASRSVLMHPPTTMKNRPLRQGPFLLQPSPRILDGSEGGDATDITYLSFGNGEDDDDGETERLGVILVAFQDGKVDLCLDVEKVEARWEVKQESDHDLPMLAVYETIDLGLALALGQKLPSRSGSSLLDLLQGNHPVFLPDPIHDDAVYIYHAFGVHALHLGALLQSLAVALREADNDDGASLSDALQRTGGSSVQPVLNSLSVERQCSNPIVGVAVPNDVYLTYSIFILTSAMRITSISLNLRSESPRSRSQASTVNNPQQHHRLIPLEGPSAYISLLGTEPFVHPPTLSQPFSHRLALSSQNSRVEFMLSPDTLRYLGSIVEDFTTQIRDVQLAHGASEARSELQQHELKRQQSKCREMIEMIENLRVRRLPSTQYRIMAVQDNQKMILARLDRMLQFLMQRASPELSEHETKWFQELKRMKVEVEGVAPSDGECLATRIALLEREYARNLPSLKAMLETEAEGKRKLAAANQGLGFSQMFKFGEQSSFERAKIATMESQVLSLASKLDLPLGRPPSQ